jgi:hypothetical protein
MATHSYNHGLVTSSKGMAIEFVKVTGLDVAAAADAECTVNDGYSNLINSCVHGATGVYTFTLNKPYPPRLLMCVPTVSSTSATTDLIHARYNNGSYSSTAGTFEVHLVNDDDSGAGVAVAGGANDELMLVLVFERYKSLGD